MVGISARFIPQYSSSPEKIGEVGSKEDEEEKVSANGMLGMENGEMVIETEINFKPIEHPPEPPDDDRPIKCPIPDSLSMIVEAECEEEPSTESRSLQTIAELLQEQEKETEKVKENENEKEESNGKSFDTNNHETPTQKSPHHKILDLFQQCKDLSA